LLSPRQDYEDQWVVEDTDWKIEIYCSHGNLYYSSYFNMKNYTMENGFWFNDERMTTGLWNFNGTVFKASEREPEQALEVFLCDDGITNATISDWSNNTSENVYDVKITFNETESITEQF